MLEMRNSRRTSDDHASLKGLTTRQGSEVAFAGLQGPGVGEQGHSAIEPAHVSPGYEEARPAVDGSPSSDILIDSPDTPTTRKDQKRKEKDSILLSVDRWTARNGHVLTYVGLFLFSIMVLFRPYEIVPGAGFLAGKAFYFALATVLIFLPSQLATEGNLTVLTTEVKAILLMTLTAVATMPIAKDPYMAWEAFNDSYIKVVIIFIVLVNVVRTRQRLTALMWLSFGIALYLSVSSVQMYLEGRFTVEDYRVAVTDIKGMFGNPNDMALHLLTMTPLAVCMGLGTKKIFTRVAFFAMAGLFVAGTMVTYSRGGFLGLLAVGMVLAWKLGRKYRLNVTIASILIGGIAVVAAPGNYGMRMLSIFLPGLDGVGSSDQRRALLERSLLVTARNPWGIGIGNFPIVGIHNLQSHNAFTQVSSELGLIGLGAYLVFMIAPFRRLGAIERKLFDSDELNWFYYLAVGLQASIVGYLVSSFFASVAYNWFIYYLIGYAVAFRRIYMGASGEPKSSEDWKTARSQFAVA
jgi:putative inorganic carbon (hco3(-)) transporter